MKMMTIYMFSFTWPWENYSIKFTTGVELDLHKCPVCMGCKIGVDFLGFGFHFAAQRGQAQLVERKNETES